MQTERGFLTAVNCALVWSYADDIPQMARSCRPGLSCALTVILTLDEDFVGVREGCSGSCTPLDNGLCLLAIQF